MVNEHKKQTETLYDPDITFEEQSRRDLEVAENLRAQLLKLLLAGKDVTSTIDQLYQFGKKVISLHLLGDETALLMDTYYLIHFLQKKMKSIGLNDHFELELGEQPFRDKYLKPYDPCPDLTASGLEIASTDTRSIDRSKIKFPESYLPIIELLNTEIINLWEKEFIDLFQKESILDGTPSFFSALCLLSEKVLSEKSTLIKKKQQDAEILVNKIFIVAKTMAWVSYKIDHDLAVKDFFTRKPAEIDDKKMADIDQDSKTITSEQVLDEKTKTTTPVSPENSSQLSQTVSLQQEYVHKEVALLVENCNTAMNILEQMPPENKESLPEVRKKREEELSDTLKTMENLTLASNMLDEEEKTIAKQNHPPKEKHIRGSNSSSSSSSSSTSAATSSRTFFSSSNSSSQSSSSSLSSTHFSSQPKDKDINSMGNLIQRGSELLKQIEYQKQLINACGGHPILRGQLETRFQGTIEKLAKVCKKIDDKKSEQSTQRVLQG